VCGKAQFKTAGAKDGANEKVKMTSKGRSKLQMNHKIQNLCCVEQNNRRLKPRVIEQEPFKAL
jgi:hypothetical protein